MKTTYRIIASFCLILLGIGGVLWLSVPSSAPNELQTVTTNTNHSAKPTSTTPYATVVEPPSTTLIGAPLPPVAYPPGSIGEACKVNEYPPRVGYYDLDLETQRNLDNSPFDYNSNEWKQLAEVNCMNALERHMNSINPYLWGRETEPQGNLSAFALVINDKPLTFERVFIDPVGDFARVQEAFTRPECQLGTATEPNWQLHESCHADAILNYALLTRFCHGDGVWNRPRGYYTKEDNPTPEQDRLMWIQGLESAWVGRKCNSLDLKLKLELPQHTELRQQIQALQDNDASKSRRQQTLTGALIDLAARLGSPSAALTQPIEHGMHTPPYDEAGYKYGPFAEWFTRDFRPYNLFTKHPPSIERLYEFLNLFAEEKLRAADGHEMKLNHDVLVQHLCTPPYYIEPYVDEDTVPEPPSCREIITELRQKPIDQAMLELIATFEDVAMRLDVYE